MTQGQRAVVAALVGGFNNLLKQGDMTTLARSLKVSIDRLPGSHLSAQIGVVRMFRAQLIGVPSSRSAR
jgi:hypothetical protein